MTDLLNQYVFAAALTELCANQQNLDKNYKSFEKTFSQIEGHVRSPVPASAIEFVISHFVEQGILNVITDDVAGKFYKIDMSAGVRFLTTVREKPNSLEFKYGVIGPQFLESALENFAQQEPDARPKLDSGVVVPASDRVVSLNHNEVSEFDERTSEIIDAIEQVNLVEGEVGLREIILGQLRAGRELIRAGSIRLYLLQVTLFDTLKFLAGRYEREAIGALAAALLTALSKHFGLEV